MKSKGLKFTMTLALAGAGIYLVKELIKNKELTETVKNEGAKIVDSTKTLGKSVSDATVAVTKEYKEKFEQENPEVVKVIKETGDIIKEKGKEFRNKLKTVNDEEFVDCDLDLDADNNGDITLEDIMNTDEIEEDNSNTDEEFKNETLEVEGEFKTDME